MTRWKNEKIKTAMELILDIRKSVNKQITGTNNLDKIVKIQVSKEILDILLVST